MDYSELDKVRRSTTPLQLDVVESFVDGRLSRREFIQRGTIVGLSMASITAIIAACGGTTTSPGASAGASAAPGGSAPAASAKTGGTIRVAVQRPVPARPGRDAGPRRLRHHRPVVRVPVHPSTRTRSDIAPRAWPTSGRRTPTAPSGRSSSARASKWHDGTPIHVGRRRRHDGAPGRRRQLRAQGRPRQGRRRRDRRQHGDIHLVGANGNFPYLVSVFNAQIADHPGRLRRRARRSTSARPGPAPGSSSTATTIASGATFDRNDDWWGGKTPLDGTEFIFFDDTGPMVTAYQGGQIDAIVQFDVLSGASAVRRRELHRRRHADDQPSPDLDAHRHGPVRRQAGPPGARPDARSPGAHPAAVQGQGRARPTTTSSGRATRTSTTRSPQRAQDIDKAKQLLADAGRTGLTATLQYGQLQRDPGPGRPAPEPGRRRRGSRSTPAGRGLDTFYDAQWCPTEADRSAVLRRTPSSASSTTATAATPGRLPQLGAQDARASGTRRSTRSPAFDAAFTEFQAAVGVDAQKAACTKIETILNDDTPVGHPVLLQLPLRQLEEVHGRVHERARADVLLGSLSRSDIASLGSGRCQPGAPVPRSSSHGR